MPSTPIPVYRPETKAGVVEDSVFDNESTDTQPSVEGLIAKLEAATEGSAELDARLQAWEYARDPLSVCWIAANNGRWYTCWANKAYTRSLDAALTLVPSGWQFEVRSVPTDEGINHSAQVNWKPMGRAYAESPALALCAAALRARQTMPQTDE